MIHDFGAREIRRIVPQADLRCGGTLMRNHTIRLFLLVFGAVLLPAFCEAANAVTPMVAAGNDHSIGLSADGKVYGWGRDESGQLGLGRTVMATVPQTVPNLNLGQGSGKSRVTAGRNAHYSY
ncbi:MAG: hypothetical protein D4S02_07840, partial [Rhodocyclaceae bacterium]